MAKAAEELQRAEERKKLKAEKAEMKAGHDLLNIAGLQRDLPT